MILSELIISAHLIHIWKIPSSCPTAVEGQWIEAPGYQVIDTLKEKIPGVNLVAEDLGDLRRKFLH